MMLSIVVVLFNKLSCCKRNQLSLLNNTE